MNLQGAGCDRADLVHLADSG